MNAASDFGLKMNEENKNSDQNINNYKPPIFWKDKDIVKQQLRYWNLGKIEKLIFYINDIELVVKKNSSISVNLLNDFILSQLPANN